MARPMFFNVFICRGLLDFWRPKKFCTWTFSALRRRRRWEDLSLSLSPAFAHESFRSIGQPGCVVFMGTLHMSPRAAAAEASAAAAQMRAATYHARTLPGYLTKSTTRRLVPLAPSPVTPPFSLLASTLQPNLAFPFPFPFPIAFILRLVQAGTFFFSFPFCVSPSTRRWECVGRVVESAARVIGRDVLLAFVCVRFFSV
ncbi:hypothetical protein BKA80DRAFT_46824 [Phyllosticta citrichinensis]